MLNAIQNHLSLTLEQLTVLDGDLILYVMLIVSVVIVLDDVLKYISENSKAVGVKPAESLKIHIDGAAKLKAKTYISEIQGISGRPDAVIKEHGFFIPVERKPIGNKVRDRHIAQLLVYMRLIEEFEGKRPPYGYLILGKKARRVKIQNTKQRQTWLTHNLRQMRTIAESDSGEKLVKAAPHPKKCEKCRVSENCSQKFERKIRPHYEPSQPVLINIGNS